MIVRLNDKNQIKIIFIIFLEKGKIQKNSFFFFSIFYN